MRTLADCHLYGILDLSYVEPSRLFQVAKAMIDGGVDLIQLRGKNRKLDELSDLALELHAMTLSAEVPLIVNDHAEIARRVPVEGVHVGQDDEPVESVRRAVNRPIWVGKSTHSVDEVLAAQQEGADYIGFGPIYATPTKPDYSPIGLSDIGGVHKQVALPVFCIGGLKLHNLPNVIAAGAKRVVIVSGLLQSNDIADYARACKQLLTAAPAELKPLQR
ncbi:MAG TPA: thiamine phosphate synthase [Chthoniobacterales bacterium]|nr:thiamine phosphate synthase [Chthoniobacterales bacterium]